MKIDRRVFLGHASAAAALAMIAPAARAQTAPGALAPLTSAAPVRRPAPPVSELIDAARLNAQVSFAALAPDGRIVEARDADLPLPPASTLKTVTALYALDRLGPAHRFRTRVLLDGDTLILAGGGDPVLDSDALAVLATEVAAAMAGRGVARFVVWGGALPQITEIAPPQADHLAYNPSLSGMILNFNRVLLDWRGGQSGPRLSLTARGEDVAPQAYSVRIAVADRAAPLLAYDGDRQTESWTIAARTMGKSGSWWLPVRRPELYAGDVFQTLARAKGLVLPAPEVGYAAPSGAEIAGHDSPPLRDILRDMLHYSTNLTAEAVGLAASGAADQAASGQAMADWLRGQGIAGEVAFADHSGLSPDSRISALTLARALAAPAARDRIETLLKTDPLAEALGAEARGSGVRGKTGTLNFVSNLAGYGPGGIVFAVLTADAARLAATAGEDLPDGVLGWTTRSKRLQRKLVERFGQLPGDTNRHATLAEIMADPRG